MTPWFALHDGHTGARALAADAQGAVRKVLGAFADGGHIAQTIRGRFTRKSHGTLCVWSIVSPSDDGEPVTIRGLEEARLHVAALVDERRRHLHQFTAMLTGTTASGQPWVVAVHFDDDRKPPLYDRRGAGAASHAAFHCHVGPDLEAHPKVRVPLPALTPADAVAWLLALVEAEMEPAPWATRPGVNPATR